ncbi:MAG: HEPN domain-containing protein [Chloroflexota bacterium]
MSGRPVDPAVQQEALRWLAWAKDDLAAAQAIARDRSLAPRNACYHAQQCAEKAIKAAILFSGKQYTWSHDLDALNKQLPAAWDVSASPVGLADLTYWAEWARYPSGRPDPTAQDARAAVLMAREVYDRIRGHLAAAGAPSLP